MMRRRRGRRRQLMLAAVALLLAGTLAYGAVRTFGDLWSRLETGEVKIGVETFDSLRDDAEKLPEHLTIDCENSVPYAPRITNFGSDCYLRVRLLATSGDHEVELANDLEDLQDGWERKGHYLYYRDPVSRGESVVLCRSFRIPEGWNPKKERSMQVRVEADALQAKNFKPDFTSGNPWGELVVTASEIDGKNRLEQMEPAEGSLEQKSGNSCSVIVDRKRGLVLEESGLFQHVSFLPGDSCRETLQLSNQETQRVQILLKANWDDSSFLDQMRLRIDNGSEFYNGVLKGTELAEYRPLAMLEPGETRTVDVSLSFPESADNPYQQNSDEIQWCFAVKRETCGGVPMTGENSCWLIVALLLCGTAVFGIRMLKRGRSDETAE